MIGKKPVMFFESQEQVDEYLEYWKGILGLSDWLIKVKLVDKGNITMDNMELSGVNNFLFENREAYIDILNHETGNTIGVTKTCAELTLVHELMHLIINYMIPEQEQYEYNYVNIHEHVKVEQLAKSFIKAKYNLDNKWFYSK